MSIELTPEQQEAIRRESLLPPRVIDRATNTTYVLIRVDVFAKMQALLDRNDVRWMEPLLAELSPEDWEDAAHYENHPGDTSR